MGRRGAAAAPPAPLSIPQPPSDTPSVAASHSPSEGRNPVVLTRAGPSRGARCAEVAGDTAAGCAAVCCCCPCGILNLLVLAAVKLPAGLCRRAFLKQRKRRKKKNGDGAGSVGTVTRRGLLGHRVGDAWEEEDDDEEEFVVFAGRAGPVVVGPGEKGVLVDWPADTSPSQDVSEMDKEMWAKFHGGGFWRSLSQRDG